tara:strand:+ start:222 stop:1112 length:891 start_codon:yes stop_codon:yes gene_type:complete
MHFKYLIYILIIFVILNFLNKKIKKYSQIYKNNGFDGVWFYFYNKNIKKTGLSNFVDKKKNFLGKKIERLSKSKILYGPYAGTKILNSFGWSSTDFAAKFLGTYESQIQKKIILLSKKFKLKNFVDLGAAEGYHIVSLLNKNYFSKGIAYEINKKSRDLLKKNSITNKVIKKISIFSGASFDSLSKNLHNINQNQTLFLVDIEGNEFNLFNDKFCNFFSKSFFIIEDHKFNVRNKKTINKFYKTIRKKFKVEIIKDIPKNPFEYKILDKFTDDEKYLMMSEGRPETMQWIVLYPKN